MLTHLYLPPLQEGKTPQMPDVAGKWDTQQKRILGSVADGIVVDEQALSRGISSVPDIWARPLMFASALRPGSQHPLRDQLLDEWRGLLGLLALSQVGGGYNLELVRVQLGSGVFADALRQLEPAAVQLETNRAYRWSNVVIIKVDGIAVGALSPRTLVYTGTDYARLLSTTTLDVKDKRGLLSIRALQGQEEKHGLAEWVVQLRRRLTKILDGDPANAGVGLINGLLRDWEEDLRQELGLGRADVDAADVDIDSEPLPVRGGEDIRNDYQVYRELLRPLKSVEPLRPRTDVALKNTRTPAKTVVLITRDAVAGDVRLWGGMRRSNLGEETDQVLARHFKGPADTRIDKEDLSKHNALWVRPEAFFLSDVLLKAAGGGAFTVVSDGILTPDARFVPPLKREILDYFSVRDLQSLGLEFVRETDQEIKFRLRLPLRNGAAVLVEKTYRYRNPEAGEGQIREIDVPTVEVFPRYLDPGWRRYYLFYQGSAEWRVQPIVAAANTEYVAREYPSVGRQRVSAIAMASDTVPADQSDSGEERLPFPEAVVFSTAEGAPAGMLLLIPPVALRALSGEWRIGIDFGTSNTNVFRQSSRAAEAERWAFRFSRLRQPLTVAPSTGSRSPHLLPSNDIDLPIPTHLVIYQEPIRQYVLLDYFMDLSARYAIPDNVYTNLKWDETDRKTDYFLESLLTMLLAEAVFERVSVVQFSCSYPKAFSQQETGQFREEWNRVMRRVTEGAARLLEIKRESVAGGHPGERPMDQDGRRQGVVPVWPQLRSGEDRFEVEGVAAGEYFASDKTIPDISDRAAKADAALCLDVGGGTTDISIWYCDRIVADGSFRLAGRQIADFLRRNFRLLEVLLTPEAVHALEEQRGVPDRFAARLNVALKREESRIQEMLIKHSNAREIQAIKRLLIFEFGAIAYYAGQLIAAADRRDAPGLLARISSIGIAFHWGGNAAKFINWIDFGWFDRNGIGPTILNAILFHALKDAGITVTPQMLAQHQSPGHKSEAAGGLVVMDFERDRIGSGAELGLEMEGAGRSGAVCGEDISLESGPLTALDLIEERHLFSGAKTTFVSTSLNRLKRFVEVLNYFGVQRGVFTNEMRIQVDDARAAKVASLVRQEFVKAQSKPEGKRRVEPVFIMEVKFLLELLQEEMRR